MIHKGVALGALLVVMRVDSRWSELLIVNHFCDVTFDCDDMHGWTLGVLLVLMLVNFIWNQLLVVNHYCDVTFGVMVHLAGS